MKLITYLSNGFPSMEGTRNLAVRYQQAGVTAAQIDFPALDPYLEGPAIAERMRSVREMDLPWRTYMSNISAIHKASPGMDLLLLAYEETIKEIGCDVLIDFCRQENLLDITVIGNKDSDLKSTLIKGGLRVSSYIQFQLDQSEIDTAMGCNGFIYLQAKPQVPASELRYPDLRSCIDFLRQKAGNERPIYTGVGIRTSEDAVMAREAGSDGIFVGSTIMKLEKTPTEQSYVIKAFKNACEGGHQQ